MYIQKCLDAGILTTHPVRKYPLRQANLATVIKAYAIMTYQPYEYNMYRLDLPKDLYLTDEGLEWFKDVLEKKGHLIGNHFLTTQMANYEGTKGERPEAGTKRGAVLKRKVGRTERTYMFATLKEAREELFSLLRFYDAEEFTLFRIHKQGHLVEVPLVLESNKRGAHLRK